MNVEINNREENLEVIISKSEVVEVAIANSTILEVATSGNSNNWYCYREIINADLTNDKIVISHGLGFHPVGVAIANNLNQGVYPSDLDQITSNSIRISLEGYTPIDGIWKIKIA